MGKIVQLACRYCTSTDIVAVDQVFVEAKITSWKKSESGAFEPEFSGASEAFWDTQASANEAQPYECKGCDEPLSVNDLVVVDEDGDAVVPVAVPATAPSETAFQFAQLTPTEECAMLTAAIREAAAAAGIAKRDTPMNVPALVGLCNDMAELINARSAVGR